MAANTTLPFRKVWNTIVGTLASGAYATAASQTIYIPMTTSRAFREVFILVTVQDVTAAGDCTLTAPVVGIDLGGIGFTETTLGNPNANSGENQSWTFLHDVTSYFTANFGAGASQTCQVRFKATLAGTTPLLDNVTIKIVGSVDVDDTDNTQMNYQEFICDSPTGNLTATLAEIGTNQWPVLDTVLGESSKVIRQVWLEIEGNNGASGTANDAALGVQIDANTEWVSGNNETGNASLGSYFYIYDATALGLSNAVAHAIKLRSTNITTGATFPCPSIKVCVYYEFSWSASSAVTNMAQYVFHVADRLRTTAQGNNATGVTVTITDPSTITPVQSGVQLYFMPTTNATFNVAVGAQAARTYTPVDGVFVGHLAVSQRTDSGGAAGSAATIARGINQLPVVVYLGTASVGGVASGIMTQVYKSAKSALGRRAHTRTLCTLVLPSTSNAGAGPFTTASAKPVFNFLDTDYYINGAGIVSYVHTQTSLTGHSITCKALSGELDGQYHYQQVGYVSYSDFEASRLCIMAPIPRSMWKRWTGDPQTTRMDVKGARDTSLICSSANSYPAMYSIVCYHGHKKSATRQVINSAGGSVTIKGYSLLTGDHVLTTQRTGDGAYTVSWFEDTVFAEFYENDTHKARSGTIVLS